MTVGPYDGDFIKWHAPSNWRDHYEVMQFTGLMDKNRIEVYEGDIVKFLYNSTPQEEHIGVVEWNERDCAFTFAKLFLEPTPRMTMEVIGNIYENPELLKDKE